MRQILFLFLFLVLSSGKLFAQDAWKKLSIKGTVTYHTVILSKSFDGEGDVVRKVESESGFTSQQDFTYFVNRFKDLSANHAKLVEYYDANSSALLMGENSSQGGGEGIASGAPIAYYSRSKSWSTCPNDNGKQLRLTNTSEVTTNLEIHGSRASLRIIPIRSQDDANLEKLMAKSLDKFAQSIMDERKARDIQNGIKKKDEDYFVPANLYNDKTFGLYPFTSLWQKGFFSTKPTIITGRYYDCELKQWNSEETKRNVTISMAEKFLENTNDENTIDYTRHIGVDIDDFKAFVRDPKKGGTFVGGSIQYFKDSTSEYEVRTTITISIPSVN